jgi:hypothetical protein
VLAKKHDVHSTKVNGSPVIGFQETLWSKIETVVENVTKLLLKLDPLPVVIEKSRFRSE